LNEINPRKFNVKQQNAVQEANDEQASQNTSGSIPLTFYQKLIDEIKLHGNDKVIELLFNLRHQKEQEAIQAQRDAEKVKAQNFKSLRT